MYWGNPAETTPLAWSTNGGVWLPAAFENLPGYQVVYHLKEAAFPFVDSTLQHPATNGVAPVPAPGVVGTAANFGGVSWLDVGTNDLGDMFTFSTWVNITVGTTDIQALWANHHGGFGTDGVALFVDSYQTADQVIDLSSGNGTAGNESKSPVGTVPFGSWHLITASVNRTNGTAQYYLDGNQVGSTTAVVKNFQTTNDLNLGEFTDGYAMAHALIDEARIQIGRQFTGLGLGELGHRCAEFNLCQLRGGEFVHCDDHLPGHWQSTHVDLAKRYATIGDSDQWSLHRCHRRNLAVSDQHHRGAAVLPRPSPVI